MGNLVQIQNIISALIGFGSAIIVAIIAGIFQLRIAKRNREIQEKQIENLREDQKKFNLEKANDKLQAETNRFYEELMKEMAFYDRLLNELHYLNNIANPKDKEFRIKGAYPYIDNNIKELVGEISLSQNIAKLLGSLRAKISLYNVALEQGADTNVLEEALKRIYDLINPINTERFENYANAQKKLRNFEIRTAKQIIQENSK